jgi:hypothetical protein
VNKLAARSASVRFRSRPCWPPNTWGRHGPRIRSSLLEGMEFTFRPDIGWRCWADAPLSTPDDTCSSCKAATSCSAVSQWEPFGKSREQICGELRGKDSIRQPLGQTRVALICDIPPQIEDWFWCRAEIGGDHHGYIVVTCLMCWAELNSFPSTGRQGVDMTQSNVLFRNLLNHWEEEDLEANRITENDFKNQCEIESFNSCFCMIFSMIRQSKSCQKCDSRSIAR